MAALNPKFLRSFYINPAPSGGAAGDMAWIFKLIYEFWGFCTNGTNDLRNPGGFATSQVTGSFLQAPAGFASGTNVLLASGSDGSTTLGMPIFTSTGVMPFSSSMEGKWIVCWKSGSTSTDDSVYRITKFVDSSSVYVDPLTGGTSIGVSGSVPQFTTRSSINFRVVDFLAAANLGWSVGNYLVIQFNDASKVNVGQRSSQAKISVGNTALSTTNTALTIQLSPSGSWDGNTTFVSESYAPVDAERDSGPGSGGAVVSDWFHTAPGGKGFVNIITGLGFIIVQCGGAFMNGVGSACHIEIPQRLYPQDRDPNPICAFNQGNIGMFMSAQVGYGYGHRFFPSPYDSLHRRWPILAKSYTGAYFHNGVWTGTIALGNVSRWSLFFNQAQNKFLMTDGILAVGTVPGQASVAGQFSLARARIRSARFTSQNYQDLIRVGDNEDRWIVAAAGIMWPWDHAVLPRNPFVKMN